MCSEYLPIKTIPNKYINSKIPPINDKKSSIFITYLDVYLF